MDQPDYISPEEIVSVLGVDREYFTDRLSKRPDFPRPAIVITRETKRWRRADFEAWCKKKEAQAAR